MAADGGRTTIRVAGFDPDALRRFAEAEMGLTLGIGLGRFGGAAFRIGHMGWLNPPMILGSLAATEAALRAFGVPHASGLEAAAGVIADALVRDAAAAPRVTGMAAGA